MKIFLLSDTHGFIDEQMQDLIHEADEVWHAGDFGDYQVANRIQELRPLRGVYGNIDGREIRAQYPEQLFFDCEGLKVGMIHIGGYPPKYAPGVKKILQEKRPEIFISGHSHILKVVKDHDLDLLHMNPGAAGKQGFHRIRTALRFEILDGEVKNLQAIELGKRG